MYRSKHVYSVLQVINLLCVVFITLFIITSSSQRTNTRKARFVTKSLHNNNRRRDIEVTARNISYQSKSESEPENDKLKMTKSKELEKSQSISLDNDKPKIHQDRLFTMTEHRNIRSELDKLVYPGQGNKKPNSDNLDSLSKSHKVQDTNQEKHNTADGINNINIKDNHRNHRIKMNSNNIERNNNNSNNIYKINSYRNNIKGNNSTYYKERISNSTKKTLLTLFTSFGNSSALTRVYENTLRIWGLLKPLVHPVLFCTNQGEFPAFHYLYIIISYHILSYYIAATVNVEDKKK